MCRPNLSSPGDVICACAEGFAYQNGVCTMLAAAENWWVFLIVALVFVIVITALVVFLIRKFKFTKTLVVEQNGQPKNLTQSNGKLYNVYKENEKLICLENIGLHV